MTPSVHWWGAENEVVARARELDPVLTAFCDEAIELLEALDRRDPETDDQIVRAIALTQVRNTLVAAWECAFAGYFAQALALCRTASEFIGVAWYAEGAPPDIHEWLAFGTRAPTRAGELLRRVLTDPRLVPTFHEMRSQLHAFIHADTTALGSIVTTTADTDGRTRYLIDVGPVVNERRFRASAFFLITLGGLAVLRATQWLGGFDSAWDELADNHLGRVGDWLIEVEP